MSNKNPLRLFTFPRLGTFFFHKLLHRIVFDEEIIEIDTTQVWARTLRCSWVHAEVPDIYVQATLTGHRKYRNFRGTLLHFNHFRNSRHTGRA
jgi:hypothetical protein